MQGTQCLHTAELAVCFSAAGALLRAPVIIQCLNCVQYCPQKDLDVGRAISNMVFFTGALPSTEAPTVISFNIISVRVTCMKN